MTKKANKNKRFAPKLKIKEGDKVVVVAGAYKDREKVREVLEIFPEKNRAIVDEVNIVKRHTKPTQDNPGGINEIAAPIHISNLMLVASDGKPTRVSYKVEDVGGKARRIRISRRTGESLDKKSS